MLSPQHSAFSTDVGKTAIQACYTQSCVREGWGCAGSLKVKYGMVCKPVIMKVYICIFVLLAVKVVHLGAVSDLTNESFIAALRQFVARRGSLELIWSDNQANFVGTVNKLRGMYKLLSQQDTECTVTNFCSLASE